MSQHLDIRNIDSSSGITPYELGVTHGHNDIGQIIIDHKNKAREEGKMEVFLELLSILKQIKDLLEA